ncbi:terminal hydrolase 16 [Seminavis robusta]|uniref:ubiquitinyl hydrolase 1 n=1 Tax=Seminavis robusta TaxID=568900 RepID=A0A9N8DAI3_9STRA|nr:terminal hydrolase 16 [Seminavis robusta]|eukprot:Sro53_g031490.1 terminal hydrolase 16 (1025) ;mRNA; f:101603-104677
MVADSALVSLPVPVPVPIQVGLPVGVSMHGVESEASSSLQATATEGSRQQNSRAAEILRIDLPQSREMKDKKLAPATASTTSTCTSTSSTDPDPDHHRNTANSSPTSVATCMNGQGQSKQQIQQTLELDLQLPINQDTTTKGTTSTENKPENHKAYTSGSSGQNGHNQSKEDQPSETKNKATNGHGHGQGHAKFSSATEEPITMSPDALASVMKDVQFSEAQDTDAILLTNKNTNTNNTNVRINTLSIQSNQNSSNIWGFLFGRPWDVSYSTSSLTRHTNHYFDHPLNNSPIPHWLALILGDVLQRLTLQIPLRSPFVLPRMISLLWNRGPNHQQCTHDANNSTASENQHPAFHLPSSLTAISRIFSSHPHNTLRRTPVVHGIPNYGQTCFLNVVLQSLASLDSVIAYAEWIDMEQKQRLQPQGAAATIPIRRKKAPVTTTASQLLLPLLRSLNGQPSTLDGTRLDPRELLWRIAQKNSQFQAQRHGLFGFSSPAHATGEQQDAQELLQALLEMMILDAKLEAPKADNSNNDEASARVATEDDDGRSDVVKTPSQRSGMSLTSMLPALEETKEEDAILHDDDEVLTCMSDKWSPRNSTNNSLCGDEQATNHHNSNVPDNVGTGTLSDPSVWNQVQMVDSAGIISSYDDARKQDTTNTNLPSSLASSFLSTTSTVVTSNSRDQQPAQQTSPLSASMQIMLSTISSITKTPLSCWTGSLVKCEACGHNRAVRNQEWRDIPIVPTALRNPSIMSSNNSLPPCQLQECLQNFTQVERVTDVECGNCSLQRDMQHWQEEVDMLRDAVTSLEQRRRQRPGDATTVLEKGELLRMELEDAEAKLLHLSQQDPDEYDPRHCTEADEDDVAGNAPNATMIRANALKCLVLTRLPSVLCLHVQRRYYNPASDRMSKTLQHVFFDEMLDLAPYCAYGGGNLNAQRIFADKNSSGSSPLDRQKQQSSPIWYRLASVIEHKGNAFGGHYVCYRRLPTHLQTPDNESKWYFCSDDVVHIVGWNQVQRAQAYMLFYEAM